jgi:hypothetical protein
VLLFDQPAQSICAANGFDSKLISSIRQDLQLECYIFIHSVPERRECQHFNCSHDNEINLMYHTWLYGAHTLDETLEVSGKIMMGVFEPNAVSPAHQEAEDILSRGVAFNQMEERLVSIVGRRFVFNSVTVLTRDALFSIHKAFRLLMPS